MATLLIQLPSGASQIHRLGGDPVVLGRSLEADINLSARGVSRRHCQITPREGSYTLADLGSKNGTYLNDELADRSALHHNDTITVGEARIIFYADESDAAETRASRRSGPSTSDAATPSPSGERPWVEENMSILLEGVSDADAARPTDPPSTGIRQFPFAAAGIAGAEIARSDLAGFVGPSAAPAAGGRARAASAADHLAALEQQLLYQQYLVDALTEFGAAASWGRLADLVAARLFRAFRLERVFLLGTRAGGPEMDLLYLSEQPLAEHRHRGPNELRYSSRAVEQVRSTRQPLLISLLTPDEHFRPASSYLESGAKLSMLAPVMVEGTLYGVLHGDSFGGSEKLTRKDLRLFAALADALGIALGQLEARRAASSSALLDDDRRPITGSGVHAGPAAGGSGGEGTPDAEAMRTLRLGGGADRPPSVEAATLVVRAIPPASWFAPDRAGAVPAELTQALLSRLFTLAAEIVEEQGGHADAVVDLAMPCVFSAATGGGTRAARAVEAGVMVLLAASEWLAEQGGVDRAPQVAVAVATGRVLRWTPGDEERRALTWGGGPLDRLLAVAPLLRPGQLALDGETITAMKDDSRFGDLRTATFAEPRGATWMDLGWKGAAALGTPPRRRS